MYQSTMHGRILSFLLLILLAAVEIHATVVLSPAPQPQPPNSFSMYGATPGSLHPQGTLNVRGDARRDARKQRSRSRVCFSVKNVVQHACVCLRGLMETSSCAIVTITGRLREEDPNALDYLIMNYLSLDVCKLLCLL
ncbi:hypothetical protein SASPL_112204 [Salvia splendens]|uniref:Dirigent protein n=1 Tax=Salvia splendens TaxID=180675 RepID=A0A8X8Y8C0_SALSN|nr:hypothetical protein SASPL_112204 [Salvia splendens]